jgi:O-antigen/teichoic acid export membrane protein
MALVRDGTAPRSASEADDATRGSAIKLAAEVVSRLLTLATTFLLARQLGVEDYGRFAKLSIYALLLAELGELGLQNLASRVLVARTIALRSLVRARLGLATVLGLVAVASAAFDAPLALLVAWFALSGWGEFLGVALRCRRRRLEEALLLLVLRASGLVAVAAALALGTGLAGVTASLALSPLPALALGAWWLERPLEGPAGERLAVRGVLAASAPLAVHGGLLLLSPRVEFLVLTWFRPDQEVGLCGAALTVFWFLSMVPSAIAAGAMPALTREAVRGDGPVRRRTAGTMALLAAPAALGLALVARPFAVLWWGGGYAPADYAATATPLRILAIAVPPLFLNWLLSASLIAAGRASYLPRLTATRVALAFVLALVLVPRFGGVGAASGLAISEWTLCGLGGLACRLVDFRVPLLKPIAVGLLLALPMALAVNGTSDHLVIAVAVGALTWGATLAAAWHLAPDLAHGLLGDLRNPGAP